MRYLPALTVLVGSVLSLPVVSAEDDSKELHGLIDKGIQTLGGEAKLKGIKAYSFKVKSTMSDGRRWTASCSFQFPDQYRIDAEETEKDVRHQYSLVVDGDKGWILRNAEVQDLREFRRLEEVKDSIRLLQLNHSLLPLKAPGVKLSSLGESKIGERPAVGIKMGGKPPEELLLYLAKDNGIPLKIRYHAFDAGEFKIFDYEELLSEYRQVDGIRFPHKVTVTRDGKPYAQHSLSDFKLLDKLDAKLFAKPSP